MTFDPDAAAAPGSGVFGLPHTPEEAAVVLLPVPFEATTSYGGGTSRGPAAILEATRQVDLFDLETGKPHEAGIAWLPVPGEIAAWNDEALPRARAVIEAGGLSPDRPDLDAAVERVDLLCAKTNAVVQGAVAHWLAKGKLVGTIGGDHSTAFGAIQAASEAHPGLGILHLDAHADLREAYEGFRWSHASIMHNVLSRLQGVARLVQFGVRDLGEREADAIQHSGGRIVSLSDVELAEAALTGTPFSKLADRIVAALPERVYLSFDIDGLDPALCPHTGTPVPGGLSFAQVGFVLKAVARSGRRIVGFDLTEVAPGPDGDDWDANVGARLLYKMIGWALRSWGTAHSISKE